MTTREQKPIELKTLEAAPKITGMAADLEGKRASRRPKERGTLWTQEFVASGKEGK